MGRSVVNRGYSMGRGVLNKSITVDNVEDGFMVTMVEWESDAEKCRGTRHMIKCDIVEAMKMLENFLKGDA